MGDVVNLNFYSRTHTCSAGSFPVLAKEFECTRQAACPGRLRVPPPRLDLPEQPVRAEATVSQNPGQLVRVVNEVPAGMGMSHGTTQVM